MALKVLQPPNKKEDTKMKTTVRSLRLALPILITLVLTLVVGVGLRAAFSGEDPTEFIGFGEGKAVPSITVNEVKGGTYEQKSVGDKSLGAIGDTVGNRFTFSFGATKDAKGKVQGQMFLRDHDLNLTVSSEMVKMEPHPKRRDVVGVKARGLNYIARIIGPKGSAVVNGKPQPGWDFRAWVFDGDKDTVCITLRDLDRKKNVYNWVAHLSSGDVRTK